MGEEQRKILRHAEKRVNLTIHHQLFYEALLEQEKHGHRLNIC